MCFIVSSIPINENCHTCDSLLLLNIPEDLTQEGNLKIFPNPSAGTFNIELYYPQQQDVQLKVVNLLGEVIVSEKVNVNGTYNKTIDLGGFVNGIYQLQIISKDNFTSRKLILNN